MSQLLDEQQSKHDGSKSEVTVSDLEDAFATTLDTNNLFQRFFTVPNTAPKQEYAGYGARWGGFTERYRVYIIVFWLAVVIPAGLICFPKFTDNTISEFVPAQGSPSKEAQDKYEDLYEIDGTDIPPSTIVLTQLKPCDGALPANETLRTTTDETVRNFVLAYNEYLMDSANEFNKEGEDRYFATLKSYYTFQDMGLNSLSEGYMSEDGTVTFLNLKFSVPEGEDEDDYIDNFVNYGNDFSPGEYVTIGFTGLRHYTIDIHEGSGDDMERMDKIVVPIAMLVLAYVLGNLPIMIIPIINIVAMIMTSGIFMYPISELIDVHSFTPAIMMSLSIALSIDYSLFLISRCAEEVCMGHSKQRAIINMLEHAGHTVLASGSTLCVCFMGMLLFPVMMLKSIGLGASVAIISALLVNLSLTPAILFTTYVGDRLLHPNKYFAMLCCNDPGSAGRGNIKQKNTDDEGLNEAPYDLMMSDEGGDLLEHELETPLDEIVVDVGEEVDTEDMKASIWYKMGKSLLNPKKGAICIVIILSFLIPIISFFPETIHSIGFDLIIPDDSAAYDTFLELSEVFGYGTMSPYSLIFDGTKSNSKIETAEAFKFMQDTISQLATLKQTPSLESFSGIAVFDGVSVPFNLYQDAIECGSSTSCENEMYRTIAYLAENDANSPGDYPIATKIVTALNVDPYTPEGTGWIEDARDILDSMSSNKYDVHLQGSASVVYDVVETVYDSFPLMITITTLTVFILMGLFFRSIVVPLRSIITIGLTQGFVFGLAVLIYQHGMLDWTGIRCFGSTLHGDISWLAPVMSFSVIVGLGLDYDVFLISRILEYREKGYNDDSAVLIGLYKTGGIITAAGIIMTLAFGGLLLSHTITLNQWAFYLASAVLLDTFVIRTVVVPILMGFTGKYSWWPRKLVDPTKDVSQL